MFKEEIKRYLKTRLKNRVSITEKTVISFLMLGFFSMVGYSRPIIIKGTKIGRPITISIDESETNLERKFYNMVINGDADLSALTKIENMDSAFHYATVYGKIDLSALTEIENMDSAFYYATVNGKIDLSGVKTITSMKNAFDASKIKSIDLSNVTEIGDITGAFTNIYNNEELGIEELKLDSLEKFKYIPDKKIDYTDDYYRPPFANIKSKLEMPNLKEANRLNAIFKYFNTKNNQKELNLEKFEGRETESAINLFNNGDKTITVDFKNFVGDNIIYAKDMLANPVYLDKGEGEITRYSINTFKTIDLSSMNLAKVENTKNMFNNIEAEELKFGTITSEKVFKDEETMAKNSLGNISGVKNFSFRYAKVNDKGDSILNLIEYGNAKYFVLPESFKEKSEKDIKNELINNENKYVLINPEKYNNGERKYYRYITTSANKEKLEDKKTYIYDTNLKNGDSTISSAPVYLLKSILYKHKTNIEGQDLIDLASALGTSRSSDDEYFKPIEFVGENGIEVVKSEEKSGEKEKVKYTIKLNDEISKKLNGKFTADTSGTANAIAMANLLQVSSNSNKRHQITAGYGTYDGHHALALGFSGITKNRNFTYRLSGSVNSKGKFAFGAGVGLMIGSETNYVPNDEVFDLKKEVKDLKAKNKELEKRLELIEKRLNLK